MNNDMPAEVRNAALEEAAQKCLSMNYYAHDTRREFAAAIRALATSPAPSVKQEAKRDREADRARFTDLAFNKWLDEGISDAGHTVWDAIHNIADAWAAWESRPYYAAPSASQGEVKVPEGFVLMPKALTAENGAKGALTGEFKEVIQIACTACDPDGESCAVCDDAGTIDHSVPIGWSNIKAIYARAVELLSAAPSVTDGGGE